MRDFDKQMEMVFQATNSLILNRIDDLEVKQL